MWCTDHSVIQSAIDQAKMKLDILGREGLKKNERLKNKNSKLDTQKSTGEDSLQNIADDNIEEDDFPLKYNCVSNLGLFTRAQGYWDFWGVIGVLSKI